jgi:hypothetical protein
MRRYILFYLCVITLVFSILPLVGADYKADIIDKIKLTNEEIPKGFTYGTVPPFAKTVIKNNPWKFDQVAIHKLASKIYPDGDHSKIADIHVTIIAKDSAPYGDDMVCYIIIYKDPVSAKNEIKKLSSFVGFNSDRAIVIIRENMAIFIHADDINNFHYIKDMAEKIKERLAGTETAKF